MTDRIPTTYGGLLDRLCRSGVIDPPEVRRIQRLLAEGDRDAIATAAHELVRELVRAGRLVLYDGRLEDLGAAIVVADPRRGHMFSLPALNAPAGVMQVTLDSANGLPASLPAGDLARLIRFHGRADRAPIERSADLKAVVVEILDFAREMTAAPAAIFFTRNLNLPAAIARGSRAIVTGAAADALRVESSETLPPAWSHWIDATRASRVRALHLTDFRLLPPEQRPLPEGSALLVPLTAEDPPWEGVLALVSQRAGHFTPQHLSRVRWLAAQFVAQLTRAIRLQTVISIDFLTRIHNRSWFIEQLARTLDGARRKHQRFALLIIDIDDFREFNKRYGFDAGDEVLRRVAQTMAHVLRSTDVIARYGGEEFAAILAPDLSSDEARQIGGRLLSAVAQLVIEVPLLDGSRKRVGVSVSIGGAMFPAHGEDRDTLWGSANRMLLEVKSSGKNAARFPA